MPAISKNHSRVLSTGITVVEDNLQRMRSLLSESGRRTMVEYRDDMPPRRRGKVLEAIDAMIAEISAFREAYRLEVQVRSKSHEAQALLSMTWATLEDLRPEKIGKAYGRLDGDPVEDLRARVRGLSDRIGELRRIVASGPARD